MPNRSTTKRKWGRSPIKTKSLPLPHTGNSYNKPCCPPVSTFTISFHLFSEPAHSLVLELPGAGTRAPSRPAQRRNWHGLPRLPCKQLLLEQLCTLMISFQILLDNRRVRERGIGWEAEAEGAKKGQPSFVVYVAWPYSPLCWHD